MQPNPPAQDNSAILAAIQSLKTEIVQEVDSRFQAQQAELEDRFKPVDQISQTLEAARKANEDAIRARAAANPQPQWQPKTWDDIPALVEQKASELVTKTLEERDTRARTAAERAANEERELEQQIDQQLDTLEKNGYLPKIGNPNDYNDPGVASRRELLAAASFMGTPELDKVADTLTELHKKNLIFDAPTKSYKDASGTLAPLPGKYAPVGSSSSRAPSYQAGPSYKDIHEARDMDSLVALAEQRGYGPVPGVAESAAPF